MRLFVSKEQDARENGCWNCDQPCLIWCVCFERASQGGLHEEITFTARNKEVRCERLGGVRRENNIDMSSPRKGMAERFGW